MKQFNLTMITTFRKPITVEAETLEEAIEIASNDVDELNSSTDTLDFDTNIVAKPEETPELLAKKARFAAMEETSSITCDRIQEKLDEIKGLTQRLNDLGETLVHAKNNGISVHKYVNSGGTRFNPVGNKYWYDCGCHRFANPNYGTDVLDEPYLIVDSKGDVFYSMYASAHANGVDQPSRTFQLGACRHSGTREEYRLAILKGLKEILRLFPTIEKTIYDDIDRQIEQKKQEEE